MLIKILIRHYIAETLLKKIEALLSKLTDIFIKVTCLEFYTMRLYSLS